jgi:four helix bundle protein
MVNEKDNNRRQSRPVAQGITGARRTARFEDLDVWRKAHGLVLAIYGATAVFPTEERFGLVSQMRRAAISVAANIAEGAKKRTARDQLNFYNIAQGSLEELRYYLILTRDLGYPSDRLDSLNSDLDRVARMLYSLAQSCRAVNRKP